MQVIKQIRLVHRITLEDSILKKIDELEKLSAGMMLDMIAEGAIASGLDEEVTENEGLLDDATMGIASANKDGFLDYCEQAFWKNHVPNDALEQVTELTSEIYNVFHLESGIIYSLMKQVVPGNIYSENEVYTIDEVICVMVDDCVDTFIILSVDNEGE